MKIAVGCDHGALSLKKTIAKHLESKGFEITDVGTHTLESCDYPDFSAAASKLVVSGECEKAIVMCTTGIGVSITANKINGIRCALLSDVASARYVREHEDTNVMALGAAIVAEPHACEIVDAWLGIE